MEGPEDLIIEKIKSAVYEAWKHIFNDYLYSLIDSMKK
jgi:hypothetical protein